MKHALLLLLFGFGAAAVELPRLPNAPTTALPIDPWGPPIACDQIVERLLQYNMMAREHDASIAGFLTQVADKVSEWHGKLEPLESKPGPIASGTFAPLREGADKISDTINLAYDNSGLLAAELNNIIESLRACGERR